MYIALGVMFVIAVTTGTLLGQNLIRSIGDSQKSPEEARIKMRQEMHRRMMDKLLYGNGPDHGMFDDMEDFIDEAMTGSVSGAQAQNYKMEWSEEAEGRTLIVTPNSTSEDLSINVDNGLVVISGKTEKKSGQVASFSSFSNSFNVPSDCDAEKVKIESKNGNILVKFPFVKVKAVQPPADINKKKPLAPTGNEIQI